MASREVGNGRESRHITSRAPEEAAGVAWETLELADCYGDVPRVLGREFLSPFAMYGRLSLDSAEYDILRAMRLRGSSKRDQCVEFAREENPEIDGETQGNILQYSIRRNQKIQTDVGMPEYVYMRPSFFRNDLKFRGNRAISPNVASELQDLACARTSANDQGG